MNRIIYLKLQIYFIKLLRVFKTSYYNGSQSKKIEEI